MKELILYGIPSQPYQILKSSIKESIINGAYKIKLKEVQDTSVFIKERLKSIPCVRFNNEIRNLPNDNIPYFIEEINQWLSEEKNTH
jgi:hypothetical protein